MSRKKRIVIALSVFFVVALAISSPFLWARATFPGMRTVAAESGNVAIGIDGTLWAWGQNSRGQIGDGTTMNRTRPVRISADTDWIGVAASSHNVAIRADGSLWAWGQNHRGQLGDGTTEDRARPVKIGTDTDWASVAVHWGVTFAVKEDGTLWHWGDRGFLVQDPDDPDAPLGFAGQGDAITPTQVGTDTDWASISVGFSSVAAIKTDGTLWVWGEVNEVYDDYNQFRRRRIISFTPLQLGTGADWASVTIGNDEILSIRADGSLWVWGAPFEDFIAPNTAEPTQIGVDTTWAMVSTAFRNYAAICTDGRLWTWGASNPWGIFGDGTPRSISGDTESRPAPVQVGTATDWVSVSLAFQHMVAVRADGRVWTSGVNDSGQLGTGSPERYSLTIRPITRRCLLSIGLVR